MTPRKDCNQGQAGQAKDQKRQQGRIGKNDTLDEEILEHKGSEMAKNDASITEGEKPVEGEHKESSENMGEGECGKQGRRSRPLGKVADCWGT